jgi:tetratricopeptide (TPR) repeat protein
MRIFRGLILGANLCLLGTIYGQVQTELNLARALISEGYLDLAEEVYTRLSSTRLSKDQKFTLELIYADLLIKEALDAKDATESDRLFERAQNRLKKLFQLGPAQHHALEARLRSGTIWLDRAEHTRAQPESKTPRLKQQILGYYKKADLALKRLLDELAKIPQPDEIQQEIRMRAEFERARCVYLESLLYTPKGERRQGLLHKAIELLSAFRLRWGDRPLVLDAANLHGLCYRAINKPIQAIEQCFDDVILYKPQQFPQYFPRDPKGRFSRLSPHAKDALMLAYYLKTETQFQDLKQYPKVIQTAQNLFDLMPEGVKFEPLGKKVLLLKVRALRLMDKKGEALAILTELMDLDPYGPFREEITQLIQELSEEVSLDETSPAQIVTILDTLMHKGRYEEVVKKGEAILKLAHKDKDRFLPQIYLRLGRSLYMLKRFEDAIGYFEKIYKGYTEHELGPKAAFQALFAMIKKPGFHTLDERYQALLDFISKHYKDKPEAKNINFLKGEVFYDRQDYLEAIRHYKLVPRDATAYENARVKLAYCYYRHGLKLIKSDRDRAQESFKDCEGVLKAYLDHVKMVAPPDELKQERDTQVLNAYYLLAHLYEWEGSGLRDMKRLIAILNDVQDESGLKRDSRYPKLIVRKISAYRQLGQIDMAQDYLERLSERYPDLSEWARIYREFAVLLDKEMEKRIKKFREENPTMDYPKEWISEFETIFRYYDRWLKHSKRLGIKLSGEDLIAAGDRLYLLTLRINRLPDTPGTLLGIDLKTPVKHEGWEKAHATYTQALKEAQEGGQKLPRQMHARLQQLRCQAMMGKIKEARRGYERFTSELLDRNGQIKFKVASEKPALLSGYEDLGYIYNALITPQNRWVAERALGVFRNIFQVSAERSARWWRVRFASLQTLWIRGQEGDYELILAGIKSIRRNHPEFDRDRFGMKTRFEKLEAAVKKRLLGE